ncbi:MULTISPECIES: ParA family protein [Methylomonas]|uniref:Chromosome partitioning protein n=2 Tax=Methylomonas TaxID=416 RepID=A0A126T541_9GAMM|nr:MULTISPECIES: ParA family protein [Methylomonas]AMK77201.1 chromosome partitioning protein [Methylomonas denitrificans]OAI05919.1 chromosome partitioning protein [Methylomonas methanica]TCV78972.1 chromosome partitioning protein [Methylomonas methanica]
MLTHIIAVSNRKGGTGKTTVSVNIAAELAAQGLRVLLVDLDSQGHCAVGVGIKAKAGEPTAHGIFLEPTATLAAASQETAFENLAITPADQLFEHGSGTRDTKRLARALAENEIAERFDVAVLDTPPSLDMLLLNALVAANWVLVPYVPHHLSYEGLRQLMRVLFKVITSEVSRQFGTLKVLPGIRSDIRLAEAFAAGKLVRHYSPKCRGADDFADLANSLIAALRSAE